MGGLKMDFKAGTTICVWVISGDIKTVWGSVISGNSSRMQTLEHEWRMKDCAPNTWSLYRAREHENIFLSFFLIAWRTHTHKKKIRYLVCFSQSDQAWVVVCSGCRWRSCWCPVGDRWTRGDPRRRRRSRNEPFSPRCMAAPPTCWKHEARRANRSCRSV